MMALTEASTSPFTDLRSTTKSSIRVSLFIRASSVKMALAPGVHKGELDHHAVEDGIEGRGPTLDAAVYTIPCTVVSGVAGHHP